MRNLIKNLMIMSLTIFLISSCSKKEAVNNEKIHIGILQYVEHASLDATRKGFIEELEKEGYVDGKNIVIDYQNAQADQSNLQTISEKLVSKNSIVLAIATPAAQALANTTDNIPIIFTAVSDPVGAKLVESMKNPGKNLTGTSDASNISMQIDLLQKLVNNVKKVGILYNANEVNSQIQVEEAEKEFKSRNIEVVLKTVASTNDVQDVITNLMSQSDAIFIPTDNTIASTMSLIGEISKEKKKAVIGGSIDMVLEGGLATYGTDYEKLGRQTAKLAIRVIKGEDIKTISAEYPKELNAIVNKDISNAIGIDSTNINKKSYVLDILLSSISQGLLWSIMAIGVYITFKLLDIADLSAEGSFPLGAAVCASLLISGVNPILATISSIFAGMCVGFTSGFLHTKMKIPTILTGIISLTALYSINLLVLKKSNVSLSKVKTLIHYFQNFGLNKVNSALVLGLIIVSIVIVIIVFLLLSEFGLAFIATGDNHMMSEANGINVNVMKIFGYALSNGLIALSGALLAQNNGYVDLNMGVGTIVFALASIILSEVIFKHLSLLKRLISIVFASIIYRFIIVIILALNIDTQMIKLVSAILLALILYAPEISIKKFIKEKN